MAKKRTRKQKEKAHHIFTVSWRPEAKKGRSEANVKSQSENTETVSIPVKHKLNKTESSERPGNLASIKKDIARSLTISGLIIGLELVLYFYL